MKCLKKHEWNLVLLAAALALARHEGTLYLRRLTSLSDAAAQALASVVVVK